MKFNRIALDIIDTGVRVTLERDSKKGVTKMSAKRMLTALKIARHFKLSMDHEWVQLGRELEEWLKVREVNNPNKVRFTDNRY